MSADRTAILLTRPEPEAGRTAGVLRERGWRVLLDPMLTIHPVPGPELDLRGVQAILVTSPNGVRATAARTAARNRPLLAVGNRTAALAVELGFTDVRDAGGAAADLAALVMLTLQPDSGGLLHVSGADQAVDLAALLGPRGFRVTRLVAYAAKPAADLRPETRDALRNGQIGWMPFFSPRSARCFVNLATAAGVAEDCRQIVALCLSPAVARVLSSSAESVPWRRIDTAPAPTAGSLLALLPSAGGRVRA
jgi:uroporphyrinogen-III synthase